MSNRNVRKKTVSIYTTLIITAIAALIYFTGTNEITPAPVSSTVENTASTARIPIYTDTVIKLPDAGMEGLNRGGYIKAKVMKVVDGDTINVEYKSSIYKVRLLCIDTPESVKSGVDIQPYGVEASSFMKREVYGKEVTLVFDKGLRDKYGRLLAFVITGDGVNVNAMLVGEGYARVEIVKPNSTFEKYFYGLEKEAVDNSLGLWGLPADEQPFVKDKNGYYIPRYYVKGKAS